MKDTYLIHKKQCKVKVDVDSILDRLEKYGRAVYSNPKAARYLSYRLRKAKNDKIFFANCKKTRQSVLALKEGYKAKRIKNNRYLELIYDSTMK